MKKFIYLFFSYSLIALLFSCTTENKEETEIFESASLLKSKTVITEVTESAPVSDMNVTPYLIPGANKGGNRTCTEVGFALANDSNYFDMCGEKIDYDNGSFVAQFPQGLNVETNGTFVSFSMDKCLKIGDYYYKVGAVIVKGSAQANVYFYPDGSMGDSGLAAPINKSGKPAGLSNLTFCFIKCEQESGLVLALKTIMTDPPETPWAYAVSGGILLPDEQFHIGYNSINLAEENIYPLIYGFGGYQIGTITASDYMENGIHYLKVVIDTDDDNWSFLESYLYVGTLSGLKNHLGYFEGKPYLIYDTFPFFENEESGIRIFKIPFTDIVE